MMEQVFLRLGEEEARTFTVPYLSSYVALQTSDNLTLFFFIGCTDCTLRTEEPDRGLEILKHPWSFLPFMGTRE